MGINNLAGAWGEAVAAEYLRKKRYHILATGYRCRYGEIDIIASDKKYLVFVEVKLRKSDKFAQAAEFVNFYKQNRLRTTASMYLAQNPTKLQPRFDVIEVYAPEGHETQNPVINHMEGAFE
jgi:putative endonuclease